MELHTYAVTAVVADNGIVVGFSMGLDYVAYIAEANARLYHVYGFVETFLGDINEPLSVGSNIPHGIHLTGIAIPTVFYNGDIDIDNNLFFINKSFQKQEINLPKGFNSYNFLVAKLAYKILSYKFLY